MTILSTPARYSLLRVASCGDPEEIATAAEIGHLLTYVGDAYTVSWVSRAFYAVRENHTGDWLECQELDDIIESLKADDHAAATAPGRGVWG